MPCTDGFHIAAIRYRGRKYLLLGRRAVYQAELLKRPCIQDFLLTLALNAVSRSSEEPSCMHQSKHGGVIVCCIGSPGMTECPFRLLGANGLAWGFSAGPELRFNRICKSGRPVNTSSSSLKASILAQ